MIPIAGMGASLALDVVDAVRTREIARLRDSPADARGIETFRERIAGIESAADLVEDPELYGFVMRAFDLEDRIFAKGMMRRIIESDPNDRTSLVNRLTDPRFERLNDALGLHDGSRPLTDPRRQEEVVDRYLATRFEGSIARQDDIVGAALAFRRAAAEIDNPYDVLKDPEISEVMRRALGLPDAMATLDVDRQAEMISGRFDLSRLSDPNEVEKIVRKYVVVAEALSGASAASNAAVRLLSDAARGTGAPISLDLAVRASVRWR